LLTCCPCLVSSLSFVNFVTRHLCCWLVSIHSSIGRLLGVTSNCLLFFYIHFVYFFIVHSFICPPIHSLVSSPCTAMSEHQRPPLHPTPAYTHPSARHHPYAPPAHRGSSSGSSNGHHAHHPLAAPHAGVSRRHSPPPPRGPPSPARSRGDEDSPPLSATKFDPADNYWEDVVSREWLYMLSQSHSALTP